MNWSQFVKEMAAAYEFQLTEEDLNKISRSLETDKWKAIARGLGLPSAKIDFIDQKENQPIEKSHRMLLEWMEASPENCKLSVLLKELRGLQLNNTAQKVQELF